MTHAQSMFRPMSLRCVCRGAIPMAAGLAVALGCLAALAADPVSKSAGKPEIMAAPPKGVPVIPQSVFLASSTTQAISDPFFPNSTRIAAAVTTTAKFTNAPAVVASDLVLKAIFGTPDRPLATINNSTFGVGEEQDVATPRGRVRVRCVEIKLQDETVIIEAAGHQRALRFSRRK